MTDTRAPRDPVSFVPADFFTPDGGANWAEKLWLTVPGPFYTGETDTGWTGRTFAPRHVLYGGEYDTEFVYRQPKTRAEVERLLGAAGFEPLGGYSGDGDSRWTPDAVRAWWDQRGRVEEHVLALLAVWTTESARQVVAEAAEGARDFLAYLAGDLEADLRAYVFRLEQGRYPDVGERLPEL
ncbi:hypothetical protein ACFFQW_29620 [Umezawaea endophytica]|uniref:Uncharacterized protein n=1 Tax=Umezawaea endophytica TaxID=1654476 RepID=A0A9X3ADW2_9PSEU|nr:hypothetical protein [Umezawaea endophytica]MCS7475275.1 hypothetical protein [Umezawaea endophytica]